MKITFRIVFVAFIFTAIMFTVIAVNKNEWNTTTASISLIIAIISAWIAFETFRNNEDQKKPILTITPDMTSRYGFIQLKLRNDGQKPAYKVKINWDNQPMNNKGEKVSFNKNNTGDYEVYVLNGKEETSVLIDTQSSFFSKYKNNDLNFGGTISYALSIDSKVKNKERFEFSFEHRRASLLHESEEPKTNYELQQIPKMLEEIKKEISKLNKR